MNASIEQIFDFMEHVSEIAQSTAYLASQLHKDSEKINTLHKEIDNIDKALISNNKKYFNMQNDYINTFTGNELTELLENTKTQHLNWMNTLNKMVETKELLYLQTNGEKCAFGHIYRTIDINHKDIKNLWISIHNPHNNLHNMASKLVYAIKNNTNDDLNVYKEEALKYSKIIFNIIDQIIDIINRNKLYDVNL
ncbi:CZB domain-containing protein [Defluviitalea phaphyphila]|uniref:CZB domain-containing protein n=1 Tax=Defluviitalea phaphyphila TaxID=1473580 RepID=UPI000731A494|nr:CZB domain-containing protein [Defluviitalea phaphyphila]